MFTLFSATMELMGIFVGHIYYFFVHQYPLEFGGRQLISPPAFLYVNNMPTLSN